MAVQTVITDRKHYNQYANAGALGSNLTKFATYLRGGVMGVQKIVYTVEIDWTAELRPNEGKEWDVDGNVLTALNGVTNWLNEGFSVGDTIDLEMLGAGTSPSWVFQDRVITNITEDKIFFDGAAIPQQDEEILANLYGGKTDLKGLEYSFGIIENTDEPFYQSLLDNSDQTYYADAIGDGSPRSTAFVPMLPKSDYNQGWVTTRGGNTKVRFVSRPSTYVQQFEIEHEYIINPYINDELYDENNSLKYVSRFDFRANLANINTAKIQTDDIQQGSVGYFDENYNGYSNDFTITDLVYTDVATLSTQTELNIGAKTRVNFSVQSASGLFSTADPFVIAHSFIPGFNTYNKSADTYRDTWVFETNRSTIDAGALSNGIILDLTASLVSANEIDVQFDIEFGASEQARLEEGDTYKIAIEVGDGDLDNQSNNVTLLIDENTYSKDQNITDLIISDEFGFNPYYLFISPTADLFSTYFGWVEDEIVSYHRFGVNRTTAKDAEILGARFKIVAYEDATGETFDLQNEELDLSEVLIAPPNTVNSNPFDIQLINDNRTRGYRLPNGDEFNLLLFETYDNDGTYQYYEWRVGFKMNWQSWIALPNADSVFIDTSDTFNGLNNRASNYSLKNGWSIRTIWQFDMQGKDADGNVGETEYNFVTQEHSIFDFDEQDDNPTTWDCEIFTFDESDNNLGGDILRDEYTKVKAVFTPQAPYIIGDIAPYWGELRIAEKNQPGFINDILSTTKVYLDDNKLIPLDGETYAKISLVSNTIEVECRVDYNSLKDGIDYKLSGRLANIDEPPELIEWIFKTQINVPADGSFDPVVTAIGGEVVTWTLIDGYSETTNSLNKVDRVGLTANELNGVCQNVVVTFSTNDATNITDINATSDKICETVDLTLFDNADVFKFGTNPDITGVTFPTSTKTMTEINFQFCGINTPVDLSVFSNLGGIVQMKSNSISSLTLPSTSQTITNFDFSSNSLSGALDLSNLTMSSIIRVNSNSLTSLILPTTTNIFTAVQFHNNSISGVIDTTNQPNIGGTFTGYSNSITGLIFPANANVFTSFQFYNNSINGVLDLSNLTNLGGIFRMYNNPALTDITFAATPQVFTEFRVDNCNLSGTFDLSNLSNLGGSIELDTNASLTSVTLPTTSQIITRFYCFSCSINYIDFTVLTGTNNNIDIDLGNNAMTAAEVNHILVDLDSTGWTGGTLVIDGTNSAPDGTSGGYDGLTAKTNLQGKGWTVTTN